MIAASIILGVLSTLFLFCMIGLCALGDESAKTLSLTHPSKTDQS